MTNASDATDATDGTDATDATNASDATDATDGTDATDATDATDVTDATDGTGAPATPGASISLRAAGQRDIDRIESLLEEGGLPSEGVRAKPEAFFLATAGTKLVGVGGIERHGSNGLLRSVVVPESHRGQGYGSRLTDALEARARSDGLERLYLLTTTAPAFFRGRGYEEVTREHIPPEIRQTAEFSELCPSSATCLRKFL
jgi:amino-acid N-acetyltransferase